MTPVAIIIPCRNSGEWLKKTVNSIYQTFKYPFKIIFIESESTDGTSEYCEQLAKENDEIEVYHIPKCGTTRSVNYGIEKAGELDVLLTQDDVIFHKFEGRDILTEMKKVSELDDCGIVTVKNGGGISGLTYLDGFRWVGTWCMFIPRKTIKKIGFFDENMNPGDGDDIEYSYRIIQNGLKIMMVDFYVDHHRKFDISMNTHEHESQTIKKRNSEYFRNKWDLGPIRPTVKIRVKETEREFYEDTLIKTAYRMKEIGFIHHDSEVFHTIVDEVKKFKDDDIYLDIGACVGDTSVWIEKGTCFAFEPSDRNYSQLLDNLKLNPKNKVVPIKKAVMHKIKNYKVIEGEHQGLDIVMPTDDKTCPETIILDEMFKGIDNIKLIKIDVEGTEIFVLEGAREIIKRCKPVIIVEVVQSEEEDIRKILEELNYSIEKIGISFIARP